MSINWPSSPTTGTTVLGPNGQTWVWDGAKWTQATPTMTNPLPAAGRMSVVGSSPSTQIIFAPFNGNLIKINGILYQIPAAGITANNTNTYVNGNGGQNLAGGTAYFVYLFNNNGVLTIDFSTTGHATSASAGNVGTEIKSGDDTRSLIGVLLTGGNTQFYNNNQYRYARTWFNRTPAVLTMAQTAFGPVSPTSWTTIITGPSFVCFYDDALFLSASGYYSNSTTATNNWLQMFLDSNTIGAQLSSIEPAANANFNMTVTGAVSGMTETQHGTSLQAIISAGALSGSLGIYGTLT